MYIRYNSVIIGTACGYHGRAAQPHRVPVVEVHLPSVGVGATDGPGVGVEPQVGVVSAPVFGAEHVEAEDRAAQVRDGEIGTGACGIKDVPM